MAAQVDTSGAREVITVTGPSAPTTYNFPLNLPSGAALIPDSNGDGGYTIESSANGITTQYGTIAAPWARAANGNHVPTNYSVQGNVLIQTVAFTASTAFPIVADPLFTFGWSIYMNLQGSTIKSLFPQIEGNVLNVGTNLATVAACFLISQIFAPLTEISSGVITFFCSLGIGITIYNLGYPPSVAQMRTELANIVPSDCYQWNVLGGQPMLYNVFGFPQSWTKVTSAGNCT